MNIMTKGTGFELTPAISEYIDEKVGGLTKYLASMDNSAVEARVEVGKTTEHHHKGNIFRAEVNLKLTGHLLRAEHESDDVYAAIDKVHDELKRQIVSLKEKMIDKRRRGHEEEVEI